MHSYDLWVPGASPLFWGAQNYLGLTELLRKVEDGPQANLRVTPVGQPTWGQLRGVLLVSSQEAANVTPFHGICVPGSLDEMEVGKHGLLSLKAGSPALATCSPVLSRPTGPSSLLSLMLWPQPWAALHLPTSPQPWIGQLFTWYLFNLLFTESTMPCSLVFGFSDPFKWLFF